MKKFLIFCFVLLASLTLSAGNPVNIAICTNFFAPRPAQNNDDRTCKLLKEYYKSELATHSGMVIIQNAALEDEALARRGIKRGTTPSADYIKKICKDVKADYLCMVGIKRTKEDKLLVEILICKADGKVVRTVSRIFDSVRSSDFAGIQLARETAVAIRGANPVDDANLERMKKELKTLSDEHLKEQIRQDIQNIK